MTKFYVTIGFADQEETAPGVWRDNIVERQYKGDVLRNTVRWSNGSVVNEPMKLDQAVSVIMDPYFNSHLQAIRYVGWLGSKWEVTSVQVNRPRITLQLGGEYHEQIP